MLETIAYVAPPLMLWLLVGFLGLIYLKHEFIPNIVAKLVKEAPLAAETMTHGIAIDQISDSGLKVSIDATLLHSRLPFERMFVRLLIPSIKITTMEGSLVGFVYPSSVIVLNGKDDAQLKQALAIDFCESVHLLKPILKRVSIIGARELSRIQVKIAFTLTISINDWVEFSGIPCEKEINLGRLKDEMDAIMASSPNQTNNQLFPNVDVYPFAEPKLGKIEAGLTIDFASPPGINFEVKEVKLRVLLNGSSVADGSINGLVFNSASKNVKIMLHLAPLMISSKPITGSITTAKGILRGAVKGFANGMLYGEWGSESVVIGARNISLVFANGQKIWWVEELLEGIEIEHELNVAKNLQLALKGKTNNLADGIISLVEIILAQPQCFVM